MKRTTVKEIKKWFKTLEENRYKRTYNSDARRVAWMVNNEGVNLSEMPETMRKKWVKAEYKKERYMANKFLESMNQNESIEDKIRQTIRETIKDLMEGSIVKFEIPMKDKKKVEMVVKKLKLKDTKDYSIYGSGKTFEMELDSKYEDKVLELLMKMNIKVRG
jgi:membrane carboxypeptidase/penicillin-binding protein PbpC